jgi:hypothetical protein
MPPAKTTLVSAPPEMTSPVIRFHFLARPQLLTRVKPSPRQASLDGPYDRSDYHTHTLGAWDRELGHITQRFRRTARHPSGVGLSIPTCDRLGRRNAGGIISALAPLCCRIPV